MTGVVFRIVDFERRVLDCSSLSTFNFKLFHLCLFPIPHHRQFERTLPPFETLSTSIRTPCNLL